MGLTTAINQAIAKDSDTLSGDARLLKDGFGVGNWRVLALIGKGGNGEVYRVQHVKSNAIGALKILHRDDSHQRRRFELESEILQKISSYTSKGTQHFPHFLDKGNIALGNIPYIVIELLQDFKLPAPHEPRMKDAEIAKLIFGVCEGIRELHKNGYLHRDIKSENLMRRENGEVVLIDFGFAIRISDIENPLANRVSVTQGKRFGVGTPGATAPEQAFGSTSISSDVYALGALANECFRGEPPARWTPIIQKATSPNKDFRYKDIDEFKKAILLCVQATRHKHIMRFFGACLAGFGLLALSTLIILSYKPGKVPLKNWRMSCQLAEQQTAEADSFSIPLTLIERMLSASFKFDLNGFTVTNDLLESCSFSQIGINPTDCQNASSRPRREMKLTDDGLDENARQTIWPFNIESFEDRLERQMFIDTNGLYRLKTTANQRPAENEKAWDRHLTIRYVNQEVEAYAIKLLDQVWPRMAERDVCSMFDTKKIPAGTLVWSIGSDCHFVIQQCKSPLRLRQYMFIQWQSGQGNPFTIATFDSFPSKKEAICAYPHLDCPAAANNLAVLMWRHQCDRMNMRPRYIKNLLEIAQSQGISVATSNLDVLREHLPEVFAVDDINFSIPPTLTERMMTAGLNLSLHESSITNDILEESALRFQSTEGPATWSNATEIAMRPRGEMTLANDGLNEKELSAIWPFEIESFEKELERRMAIDTNGLYRLRKNTNQRQMESCEFWDGERTMRYVNWEIEAWAIEKLNQVWPRMSQADFNEMTGEKMPEGTLVWKIDDDWYFAIERTNEQPFDWRRYVFVHRLDKLTPLANFYSFPSKKEAATVLPHRESPAAANNLAVLMWRHQCDRTEMRPELIKRLLDLAKEDGLSVAAENLDILRQHIPEVFK